jgi:hypothetical protein
MLEQRLIIPDADQMPWAYGGAAVAVLGLIAIFVSRRIS